ncbi:MAG: tetratricopeptide repeat protein [Deltaproteobacteria bacterium]|nr:tetratricopeptide repeat protein [Deltaproteobacteria bacterium]
MAERLSETQLAQLSEFVAERMGFYFPRERWPDLERGMRSVARAFDFEDTESCIRWLVSSPVTQNQIETLASHLTVGETYFFRERQSFQILKERVLPELIRQRRGMDQRLRIWSAGCCTGEEPYSIAILLREILPDLKDWRNTILATDINPHFLKKAAEGIYGEWSFRGVPPGTKDRHFAKKHGDRFEILPEIRRMVTFSYLNLAEDAYPSLLNNTNAMDVIFCRNVLMYFAPERAKQVIRKFHLSLVEGGWLVVSPSEASQILYSQFVTVNFPDVILYKKDSYKASAGVPYGLEEKPGPSLQPAFAFSFASPPDPEPVIAEPQAEFVVTDAQEPDVVETESVPYAETLGLYEQGRYQEAAQMLSALLTEDPGNAKAMALLARVHANQGNLTEATRWCEKALAADKLNPAYHVLHATILQELGSTQEAVRALQRALYLDQNLVLAHFALGNIARQQGKFKEATRHFENARILLGAYAQEEILPESEGMTAGRLREIMRSTNGTQVSAISREQSFPRQTLKK